MTDSPEKMAVRRWRSAAGIRPRIVFESSDLVTASAGGGLGVAQVPAEEPVPPGLAVVPSPTRARPGMSG